MEDQARNHTAILETNDEIISTDVVTDKKKNRDIVVDFIRIIACLMVIGTHITLTTYNIYEVQVDWSRLLTKCFLADGVGIFFLIIGFFIANGRNYPNIVIHAIKKVILPSILLLIFADIFSKFLVNQATFMECIRNIGIQNVQDIIYCILKGNVREFVPSAIHLWYIFDYIKIILWFPILRCICQDCKEAKYARRIAIVLSIGSIGIEEIQKFFTLSIGKIEIFSIIDAKLLLVLLGYEISCYKDTIKNNKKIGIVAFLCFIVVNSVRYKLEMQYMIVNHLVKEEAFINWDTLFGIISAVSLFIAVYTIEINNKTLSSIITWISGMTFGIYLIHYLVIAKIDLFKFEKISTIKFEMLYMIVGIITIFFMSLVICWILKVLSDTVKSGIKCIIRQKK